VLQNEERGEQKGHEKVENGMAVEVPHPNPCYPEGYEAGKRAHDDAAPLYVDPNSRRSEPCLWRNSGRRPEYQRGRGELLVLQLEKREVLP